MKRFEIFWNDGKSDAEDFVKTVVADSLDHIAYVQDGEYLMFKTPESYIEFADITDEYSLKYLKDYWEHGWVGFREITEEGNDE